MKTPIARREFLRRAGLSAGWLGLGSIVFESLMGQLINKAMADTVTGGGSAGVGNYLHLSFPGAPPRWLFDLPLTPTAPPSADNFIAGSFGTALTSVNGVVQPQYVVEAVKIGEKTLYLPPVWQMGLSQQRFTDLLQNAVFVRGMDMQINSHPLSNQKQVAPILGGYSLTGVVADRSKLPIPGISDPGTPASAAFHSKEGFAASAINYGSANPSANLLQPFTDFLSARQVSSAGVVPLQQQAFQEFEAYASQRGFSESALPQMYDNAIQLIENNVYALSGQWASVLAKYQGLINEALAPGSKLSGITDRAIASTSSKSFSYNLLSGTTGQVNLPDIRDLITTTTQAPNMAANFALAEMLLGSLTSSMCLGFSDLSGIQVSTAQPLVTLTHDQHFTGNVVSTFTSTLFYRAFLGCLTEFVSQLKAKNNFNKTVIHISAEFSRTPKADASGSDHGYLGSGATLISGMIPQPGVMGHVFKNSGSTTYPGTWGLAAPYALDGFTRPIQPNDVARQVSLMLGVDDVVTNGMILMSKGGAGWIPRGGANNV